MTHSYRSLQAAVDAASSDGGRPASARVQRCGSSSQRRLRAGPLRLGEAIEKVPRAAAARLATGLPRAYLRAGRAIPISVAFASVLKCMLNPTTAAAVSAATGRRSIDRACTVKM